MPRGAPEPAPAATSAPASARYPEAALSAQPTTAPVRWSRGASPTGARANVCPPHARRRGRGTDSRPSFQVSKTFEPALHFFMGLGIFQARQLFLNTTLSRGG